jgi:hypothetical protein
MRWVVVTPTFAAGLGVVVAAAMAAPTRSVLLSPRPDLGQPCPVKGCGSVNGKGMLATRPGTQLLAPKLVPNGGSRALAGKGQPTAPSGAGSGSLAAREVMVHYQTLRQDWGGDFIGEITLASRTGQPLGAWTLQFSYPSGRIAAVWGGAPLSHGPHTVTVSAGQYAGGSPEGHQIQIMFSVSGQAGPPASCTIDGRACQYASGLGG